MFLLQAGGGARGWQGRFASPPGPYATFFHAVSAVVGWHSFGIGQWIGAVDCRVQGKKTDDDRPTPGLLRLRTYLSRATWEVVYTDTLFLTNRGGHPEGLFLSAASTALALACL